MPAAPIVAMNDMIRITVPPPLLIPTLAAPISLIGKGAPIMAHNQPVCVQGDEYPPVLMAPVQYTSGPFVTPGMMKVTITLIPGTHLTMLTKFGGKPALIKGGPFQVLFTITVPAMQPTPAGPVPDPVASVPSTGEFIVTNTTHQAA